MSNSIRELTRLYLNRVSSPFLFTIIITTVFALSTSIAALVAVQVHSTEISDRLYLDTKSTADSYLGIYKLAGPEAVISEIKRQAQFANDNTTLASFWFSKTKTATGTLLVHAPFDGRSSLSVGKEISSVTDVGDESDGRYYGFGIKVDDGWILVAKDSRWVSDSQELLTESILWGLGIAMTIVTIVAFSIAKLSQMRVHSINTVLNKAANGQLNVRCEVSPHERDELATVSRGINQTLEQLETSIQSLQQVSSDIAHDLRRPLTRLRLKLEGLSHEHDTKLKNLDSAIEDVDRLSATFDSVLELAQIESGIEEIESKPVELGELCRETLELFEPIAEESGHYLPPITSQNFVTVAGDSNLLRQAIINLVDNAMRYTPAGSEIRISYGFLKSQPYLQVSDNGPGIDASELELVVRRFYRADKSRNIEGTGLGLSLIKAIAARHNAELKLADNKPGLQVTLIFK